VHIVRESADIRKMNLLSRFKDGFVRKKFFSPLIQIPSTLLTGKKDALRIPVKLIMPWIIIKFGGNHAPAITFVRSRKAGYPPYPCNNASCYHVVNPRV